ncbi:MAG: hypothetical protein CL908_13375 [Deltaproteobacteria bacterium]|nr:hypothetical protein [Deltaproteobacteria bacterium]
MSAAAEMAIRLSEASVKKAWDVYSIFDWPESLDPAAHWYMSPEMISIYGTEAYEKLSESDQKRLSFYELVNLFSFVLLGERALNEGMTNRMYRNATAGAITEYLHHFVDEENKHMIMFGKFCGKYADGIYPEKKLVIPREFAKGEEDISFFCCVLIVEELGDIYNLKMMGDDRIHPLVAHINKVHHIDEARHMGFGRQYVSELFEHHSKGWSEEQLASFQKWLCDYLVSTWGDFYNPSVYRDAGIDDAYQIRKMAIAHPTCRQMRTDVSQKIVDFFVKQGLLDEAPAL